MFIAASAAIPFSEKLGDRRPQLHKNSSARTAETNMSRHGNCCRSINGIKIVIPRRYVVCSAMETKNANNNSAGLLEKLTYGGDFICISFGRFSDSKKTATNIHKPIEA
jgi:hypothetical protein